VRKLTAKELKRKLRAAGWKFEEGAEHTLATHKGKPGVQIPITRGSGDIPTGTLARILKQAGLK
jgi:predicted RNA binding protein YcfA (HicA-like mRNA interferase family)